MAKQPTTPPLLSATKIYEVPGFVVGKMMYEQTMYMLARAHSLAQPIRHLTFLLIQTCF